MADFHATRSGNNGGATATVGAEDPRRLTTPELVGLLAGRATRLAEKQVELIKAEVRADVRAEIRAAIGLGIAAVLAIVAISLLFVAAALALALVMPAWGAALVMAGVALLAGAIAGLIGWRRRVVSPMKQTRAALKETLQWAREQLTGGES